jgi:hypothetical protein
MVLGRNNTVGTASSMVFGHDNISTGYGGSNIILG